MKRPPYLHRKITRHGNVAWYFWRGEGHKRVRIRGDYGSNEFLAAYMEAFAGHAPAPVVRIRETPDSLAWLIGRFRETSDWSSMSEATRRQRENIFRRAIEASGERPYRSMTIESVSATVDKMKDRPSAANNFLATFRQLFAWAIRVRLAETDPTSQVKYLRRPRTGGFRQWTEEEIAQFERRWPIGTRERLALAVLLYTGLRRGDAARLGRQHIRHGRIIIITEKTGEMVSMPVAPALAEIIKASQIGGLALVANTRTGEPMAKEAFSNWFKRAAKAAGVPGNCHGLRKAAATRLAEAGATIPEMNAVFGWRGTAMASLYTEKANREILADNAAAKMRAK